MQIAKNITKYCVWAGMFTVPFIHFIVASTMFFPFITGKGFTFRILVEVVAGLYVMLAFLEPAYRPKMSWITKAVLFFVVAVLIADLLSANPYKSFWSNYERMEGFVLIAHLALYYIVASSMLNVKRWTYFFNTTIAASILTSLYGVMQIAGRATINQGGVRVDSTFGNATYFAVYLIFHIFLCLYMLIDSAKPTWQRWVYGVTALLHVFVLYFTATRGAILGLIGGLLLAGIIIVVKEKQNVRLRKIGFGVMGAIVALVLVFIALRQTPFVQNSPVLVRFASLGPSEIRTQGRYFVWPMAIKGFLERPVFGWGQESFNFVFNKYYDPRMYGQEQWFDRTHNIFLDWLIAGGIVGLASYLSLYAALLYYVWRKEGLLTTLERSVLTGMIAAYLFHNIFVFDNLISYILFFSVLAYMHSRSVEGSIETRAFYTKTFSTTTIYYAIIPVVAVVTIASVYYVNIPAINANKTLIQAISPQSAGLGTNLELFKKVFVYNSFGTGEAVEQIAQAAPQIYSGQAPLEVRQGFYDLAKKEIEEKIAQSPKDARYLVFAGSFFNRLGQYDEAIKYLERAIAESPNKQTIYFELGSAYLGKGDAKKMGEILKTAYDLEPTAVESKVLYAIASIYNRDAEMLRKLSSEIPQDIIISDNRILQAYANIGDFTTVINILNARLAKNPTDKQAKLYLASVYATTGQKQKAIDILREMIQQDSSFKAEGESYIQQIQSQ